MVRNLQAIRLTRDHENTGILSYDSFFPIIRMFAQVKITSVATLIAVSLSLIPPLAIGKTFSDVSTSTSYKTAIESLQEKGVIEGYADGSFKPGSQINRAEFLKIVLESRNDISFEGSNCFPDVKDDWYAKYVCTAEEEDIIQGYPDGLFKPDQNINFVEATKILSLAYRQPINQYSPDWYEPYVRAIESSKAIPPSISSLDRKITRGEMVEMMWRLSENITDQPTKAYINVKYPDVSINLASDVPQFAKSCVDLQAFSAEAARNGNGGGMMMRDIALGAPATQEKAANGTASDGDYSQTNVQVEGVDEGDIVKTDGTYVYIVRNYQIRIVDLSAAPKDLATIDLEEVGFQPSDLYIEGNRLIVLGSRWNQGGPVQIMDSTGSPPVEKRMAESMIWPGYQMQKAEVRIYDVSDHSNPKLERKVAFEGNTVSSRKIGDKLYLVVNNPFRFGGPIPLTKNPAAEEVVPLMEDSARGEMQRAVAPCDDVMILPRVPSPQYLTVGVIPLNNPTGDVKTAVVLGSAENIYASLENLFVATTEYRYSWIMENAGDARNDGPTEKTNLYRFAFTNDGLQWKLRARFRDAS